MALDSKSQKIGRRGETAVWRVFEDLGFVCNDIVEDYGEDFYVLGEDRGAIEPFRIFVQVKASEAFETNPSDWTEYCDPLTVRNWILGNDMTIVVRVNLTTGEMRYNVPEDECEYWEISYSSAVPIRLIEGFDSSVAEKLMWVARLRHYDRLMRLTMPNHFEKHEHLEVPRFRLFLFEFLVRVRVIWDGVISPDAALLYEKLQESTADGDAYEDSDDMTAHEKLRYATCFQLILLMTAKTAGHQLGMATYFLDQAACVLIQFVVAAEEDGSIRT